MMRIKSVDRKHGSAPTDAAKRIRAVVQSSKLKYFIKTLSTFD